MGRTAKNYSEFHNTGGLVSYDELISATKEYRKVKPVDTEKTIYLVSKAKGDRNLREFGAAAEHINYTQLSRILSGTSLVIGNKGIAAIVAAAMPGAGVTLDALMEAQGRVRVDSLHDYNLTCKLMIRQIMEDSLLTDGYALRMKKSDSDAAKLSIEINKANKKAGYIWNAEIMTFPTRTGSADYSDEANYLLSQLLKCSLESTDTDRYSFVIDNEQVYSAIKEKAENIRVPNEVSIVLVDIRGRRVAEEFIVPLTQGKNTGSLFAAARDSEGDSSQYSLEELYKKDCRAIIADELLKNRSTISSFGKHGKTAGNGVIGVKSDFSLSVSEGDLDASVRTFFVQSSADITDYAQISEEVHAWFAQALASFHIGYRGKLSMIIDNSMIYDAIVDELSRLKIQDAISIILINTDERKIISEKSFGK